MDHDTWNENLEEFWGPEYPILGGDPPPASAERVRAWEDRHGFRLPATLAGVLALQDGGGVRGADLTLYPLDQMTPLGDGLFWLGTDDASAVYLVLDFHTDGEPRVLVLPHRFCHPDEARPVSGVRSFDDLIAVMHERGLKTRIW